MILAKTWPPGEARPPVGERHHDDSDPSLFADAPPFAPGTPEEQFLRNHLSYLAPTAGTRAGLALHILAGSTINLSIIALPLVLSGLLAGLYLYPNELAPAPTECQPVPCSAAPVTPSWTPWAAGGLFGAAFLFALIEAFAPHQRHSTRAVYDTWKVRLLALGFLSLAVLVVLPAVAAELLRASLGDGGHGQRTVGISLAVIVAVLVVAIGTARAYLSRDAPAARVGQFITAVLTGAAGILAPALLLLFVSVGVAIGASLTTDGDVDSADLTIVVLLGTMLFCLWMTVDLTAASLHPFYKRRLASAFSLRRVKIITAGGEEIQAVQRDADALVLCP